MSFLDFFSSNFLKAEDKTVEFVDFLEVFDPLRNPTVSGEEKFDIKGDIDMMNSRIDFFTKIYFEENKHFLD